MYRKLFKRIIDIIASGVAIVLLSPVILVVAILVKVKIGSPVFFRQERPGKDEKIFQLYKFRTMTNGKDKFGNLLSDEERLTKFGNILRKTSLDELPELLNIFKGDMSFVGPRPLLVRYLPYYKPEERARHSVRPGLTGLAQINGRNNLGWDMRLKYDIDYVERITFSRDVNIIIKTFVKVCQRKDVATGEQLIMDDLDVERRKDK